MKIAVGKVVECFVFLPTLTLNWIETNEGSILFSSTCMAILVYRMFYTK